MTLETYIENLYQKASNSVKEYTEMLYIQAKSNISKESEKEINEKLIENYLVKRGYSMNYILGKMVMTKRFTCVFVDKNVVEVWHDIGHKNKSVFVNESLLTGLPIVLSYMERI